MTNKSLAAVAAAFIVALAANLALALAQDTSSSTGFTLDPEVEEGLTSLSKEIGVVEKGPVGDIQTRSSM
ncbi:hypothetical protein [Ochrobactrum sp. EDr1-4]|uniref:hypothetical protein n=1 Tax=Ochrobactrum sp. EDr1-4 TaxID=3368622 RepID=UPI003BA1E284